MSNINQHVTYTASGQPVNTTLHRENSREYGYAANSNLGTGINTGPTLNANSNVGVNAPLASNLNSNAIYNSSVPVANSGLYNPNMPIGTTGSVYNSNMPIGNTGGVYNSNVPIGTTGAVYSNVPVVNPIVPVGTTTASNYFNVRDDNRPVSYATNHQHNAIADADYPSSHLPFGSQGHQATVPILVPAVVPVSTVPVYGQQQPQKNRCPPALLGLLALLALIGIILGLLFGLGVIGGRQPDLNSPSVSSAGKPELTDYVIINGVKYSPYTITVETSTVNETRATSGVSSSNIRPTNPSSSSAAQSGSTVVVATTPISANPTNTARPVIAPTTNSSSTPISTPPTTTVTPIVASSSNPSSSNPSSTPSSTTPTNSGTPVIVRSTTTTDTSNSNINNSGSNMNSGNLRQGTSSISSTTSTIIPGNVQGQTTVTTTTPLSNETPLRIKTVTSTNL